MGSPVKKVKYTVTKLQFYFFYSVIKFSFENVRLLFPI